MTHPRPLPLDDERWASLPHAYGSAEDVPELIAALARGEDRRKTANMREGVWHQIWSALCHQGSVYTATFAAVPHIVAIGLTRSRDEQLDFWAFVGGVVTPMDAAPIPDDLRPAYEAAVARARAEVVHCIVGGIDERTACWGLRAVAGLRGWREIGNGVEGIACDEITPECPGCGEQLYVTTVELPFVVSVDDPVRGKPKRTTTPMTTAPRAELVDLAALARNAELDLLARKIEALESTVTCPSCAARHHLLDPPPC